MTRTLADFARACGGALHGEDRTFGGVSTDTRTLGQGELFVALRGPNFDGGNFLNVAAERGAAGALVDAQRAVELPQIVTGDTLTALQRGATHWREQFDIPLVGVAGSNGKTTVKEMTSAILATAGNTLATRGNLNNHIGVPLTVLRLAEGHRYAVVEMGANRPGEVAALTRIARPTVGLITNAGAEHLEGFGTLEGAARAEGEVVEHLAPDATAVINADDAFAGMWRGLTRARIVSFGIREPADFSARGVHGEIGPEGFSTRFTLRSPLGEAEIDLRLAGSHNVMNALAAAAAACAAGVRLEQVARGLAQVRAVRGRLQLKIARSGAWLIDDSYNANPSSVRAGIEVLAELGGRRWLVLGDMAELGNFAQQAHAEIGSFARERGIERLYATGALAALAVESFGAGAQWYPDADALSQALAVAATAEVRMLIKGSRVNRLERVVDALVGAGPQRVGDN